MTALLLAAALLAGPAAGSGGISLAKGPRPQVAQLCRSARNRLDMLLPRSADAALAQLLQELVRSGVQVRLLLDPGYKSNRRAAAVFRKAGFKLRWLKQGQPGDMNARLIVADSARVLSGSFEATTASLDERLESLAQSDDPALASDLQRQFEAWWKKGSVKMEEGVVLDDALEKLGDPRTDEDRTPRIKKRSSAAP